MTPEVSGYVFVVLKILCLIGIALYGVFAGILVRQEQLMAGVLEESFEPMIRMLVIIHLILVVVLFLFALILL